MLNFAENGDCFVRNLILGILLYGSKCGLYPSTTQYTLFAHLPKVKIQALPQDRRRLVVQTAEENYVVSCS